MQGSTRTIGFVAAAVAGGLALTAVGTATNEQLTPAAAAAKRTPTRASAAAALSALPTAFEPVRRGFLARGAGYDVFLDDRGATVALLHGASRRATLLRSTLSGGRRVAPRSESRLPGVVNRAIGPRSTWRSQIPTYARVRYRSVYPGIDAVYHGRAGVLEYDFNVAPGADARRIAIRLSGARSLRITRAGDLAIRLTHGTVRQSRPVAFQRIAGRRVPVHARYRLDHGRIRFVLGAYDRSKPLVIDPVLSYATYFGAGGMDIVTSVGLGSDGTIFMAGGTHSSTLPGGPPARTYSNQDAFVTRIAANGSSVISTTIFGGEHANAGWIDSFADDQVNDMLVSGTTAIVVGGAKSSGFPVSASSGALGSCTAGGENGFLTFISSAGTVGYSSCFGGDSDDAALSLATRYAGGLGKTTYYAIAGRTKSATWAAASAGPAMAGFQSSFGGYQDGFLLQVGSDNDPGCQAPGQYCTYQHYRTFIGGNVSDVAYGVAYDTSGYAVVTGDTASTTTFPASSGSALGGTDAWIGRYGVTAGPTNARTYLLRYGNDGEDSALDIALDSSNNSYIVGSTTSDTLPLGAVTGNLVRGGGTDGFIAKLDSSGVVSDSVFVGGTNEDSLNRIVLRQNGSSVAEYVVGDTASGPSATFVPRNTVPGQSCTDGNTQAFVVKRIVGATPEGAVIACLGGNDSDGDHGTGIAVPASVTDGTMWIAGYTGGGFPGINGFQTNHAGANYDGFLAKLTQAPATIDSGPAPGALVNSSVEFHVTPSEAGMHLGCSSPVANQLVAGTRGTANCPGSTASYTGLADGDHTFEATGIDDFGSESAPVSRTFTVDGTPPDTFDLISPVEGATGPSPKPTFSWSESHDAHGVTYSVLVDDQPIQTVAAPFCSGGTCSVQPVAPILDGAHKVKVLATDGSSPANTRASTSTRNFTVADPVVARFTIAPNPALVGRSVQFDGSTSNDASHVVTHYEWDLDGDGTFETDAGSSPTTTQTYGAAGTFNVGLRVTDSRGAVGSSSQSLKVNDPGAAATQVGVSINEGAQYTNTPRVTVKIGAPAGTTSLLIANDGGFVGALPQPVTSTVDWTLNSSGPERLPKTVYVRFLTGVFASANYTDDIILDERPPIVDSAAIAGPPAAAATAATLKTYKVKVKAHDTNSGVGFVQVTAKKSKPGKLLAYKKALKVKSAARPKFLRARDKAGNFSKWKKLR